MTADATRRNLKLTSVVLAVWAALCLADEWRPGIITVHKAKFLTLAHERLLCGESFRQMLTNATIPDQEGNLPAFASSTLNYKLMDIRLIDYEKPNVEVLINPNDSITLMVEVPKISFSCKHELELKTGNWTFYKVSGNVSIYLTGVKQSMFREIVILRENDEKVKYIPYNCTTTIEDVDLKFSEFLSEVTGSRIYSDYLKKEIADLMSTVSMNITELKMSFERNLTDAMYLDMSILWQPRIRNSSVEYPHRGEIRHQNDTRPYTSWPQTISAPDSDAMVSCALSNWTFDTLGVLIYDQKMFDYMFTVEDLTVDSKQLLNTTCVGDCFGNLFPNVSKLYPNRFVELLVATLEKPQIAIGTDGLRVNIKLKITACVASRAGSSEERLFSVVFELVAIVHPVIKDDRIVFELVRPGNLSQPVLSSDIGHLRPEDVIVVCEMTILKTIVPFFDVMKRKGFPLRAISMFNITYRNDERTDDALLLMVNLE